MSRIPRGNESESGDRLPCHFPTAALNDGYEVSTYGERIADVYDQIVTGRLGSVTDVVSFLQKHGRGGRVLELGVGTGRIALDLIAEGIEVWGIDSSPRMIEQLKAKPGGDRIGVILGDFADCDAPGKFSVVFVAFNTFFMLTSQEEQIRCFHNVAERMEPGAAFVIEAMVPDPTMYDLGQRVHAHSVDESEVWLEVSRYDAVKQAIVAQNIFLTEAGVKLRPAQLRLTWPSELDLMAGLAGMRLESRWAGWRQEPFGPDSHVHVSLYRKD